MFCGNLIHRRLSQSQVLGDVLTIQNFSRAITSSQPPGDSVRLSTLPGNQADRAVGNLLVVEHHTPLIGSQAMG
jgi:hypothetical protein